MIKLKSLFRRGGGPPTKQSPNNSNQLRGAASTSSLNSIGLSTTSSSTTATTKSSKSTLKKGIHTGSNDHFESATFHESHESLDLKNASKLYVQSGGGGGGRGSGCGGGGIGPRTHDELRADQLHYRQTSMLSPTEQHLSPSKSASTSGCINKLSSEYRDSDNETGVDDAGTSCFSGSMRDLLSTENLTEDCTFNGMEESQVQNSLIFGLVSSHFSYVRTPRTQIVAVHIQCSNVYVSIFNIINCTASNDF